jgi:hypothetical protein
MKPSRRDFVKQGVLWVPAMELAARRSFGQARIPGPGGATASAQAPANIALVSWVMGPATPAAGGGASAAINTAGANFLVLIEANDSGSPTVGDSRSNTWTPLTGGAIPPHINIYYAQSPSVGASHTFSVTGPSQYPGFCVMAFSGMMPINVYEAGTWGYNTSGGNTVQAGSITPGSGHNLIVTGSSYVYTGQSFSVGSGFSAPLCIPNAGLNYVLSASYCIQSGSTAVNPTWTASPGSLSGAQGAVVAAFEGQ